MIDINKAIESLDWQREPRGLYEPIEYTLASGGKRLRPTLALIAAEAIVNGGLLNGGVEQFILNYYSHLDHNKVSFSIVGMILKKVL